MDPKKNGFMVTATVFKAHCLEPMDHVEASGVTITIAIHGKPAARLVPLASKLTSFVGALPVMALGDILRPTGETCNADR